MCFKRKGRKLDKNAIVSATQSFLGASDAATFIYIPVLSSNSKP
jgi:hypothetical protein